jgi:hypothetical protein
MKNIPTMPSIDPVALKPMLGVNQIPEVLGAKNQPNDPKINESNNSATPIHNVFLGVKLLKFFPFFFY